MDHDIFDEFANNSGLEIEHRTDLKKLYFQFLADFKNYLVDFVKESAIDLTISSLEVTTTPQKLFLGETGGINLTVKNQGEVACYLTTDRRGGYRLDPNEKQQFWLNKETMIMTLSGQTMLGFIRM